MTDDQTISVSGQDALGGLKEARKLRLVKRTLSVSTSNMIARILAPIADRRRMHPTDGVYMRELLRSFMASAPEVAVEFGHEAWTADGLDAKYISGAWDVFSALTSA